jgi:hypothetical protein
MEREDLYEAAVRAVLDLCDEAEDDASDERPVPAVVTTMDLRKVIKDALLMDQEEA